MIRGAHRAAVALILALLAGCSALRPGANEDLPLERQILLTVEQHDFSALALTGQPASRYLRRRGYGDAPPTVDRVLDQLADDYDIERKEGWPIRALGVYCEVFVVPRDADVADVVERLLADPRVDLAQRMNVFEGRANRYDDPLADLQPAAVALGVEEAHQLATGKGVLVAVIDSAVDDAHPDLAGRVRIAHDLVDARRRRPAKPEVHGTAVAGIIASAINNREGIVGIAPDVALATLRACWAHPQYAGGARCSSFTLAQALEVAIGVEPHVINLSVAGPDDPLLARLLDVAIARGIVVVAAAAEASDEVEAGGEGDAGGEADAGGDGDADAAGGDGGLHDDVSFPASHPSVIVALAASSANASRASDAAYRLPAPADEILTTTPGASYAFFSGTSFAAAHVSGVIALLIERAPRIDTARVADVLKASTVVNDSGPSVNACYALEQVMDVRACTPPAASQRAQESSRSQRAQESSRSQRAQEAPRSERAQEAPPSQRAPKPYDALSTHASPAVVPIGLAK